VEIFQVGHLGPEQNSEDASQTDTESALTSLASSRHSSAEPPDLDLTSDLDSELFRSDTDCHSDPESDLTSLPGTHDSSPEHIENPVTPRRLITYSRRDREHVHAERAAAHAEWEECCRVAGEAIAAVTPPSPHRSLCFLHRETAEALARENGFDIFAPLNGYGLFTRS
jgi:hypothetical protein